MKKLKLLLGLCMVTIAASAADAPTASTPVVGNVYYLYNPIEGKFLSLDGNIPYVRNTGLAWKLENSETEGYITLHVNNTPNGYLWGKYWANYAGDYANYPSEVRFKLVEKEAGSTYKLYAGAWEGTDNAYVYLNYGRVACNSHEQSNLDEAYTLWQFVTEADYVTFMSKKYSAGDDVTDYINNYHFTNCSKDNFPGWMISNPNNGNAQPLGDTDVEYWIGTAANGNFDFYQTVTGLPEGRYTISASMFNSGNGVAGNAANGNAGVYGTSNGITAFAGVTIESDRNNHNTYSTSIFVNNNELRLGVKNNGTMGARWFGVDWIKLYYLGKVVQDYAVALPTDGVMEADTWYYFDIAAAADNYDATATALDNIICTSDANALTSIVTGNKTLTAKNNALEATRYYVKSSSANKLVVAASSFTYSVSEATLDKTYIQPGQTVTVSYTVSTNNPDATLAQDYSGVTFNGEAVTYTATASGFTFTVPTGIATAAELTLTIPAGVIGYAAGNTFNAVQEFTLKTPALFDGTYFFRVENMTAAKGKYLARGYNYGTHATIDKYGLPIIVTTDADNVTTLSPADTKRYYYHGNSYDCWADLASVSDAAKFTLTLNEGKYRIHNNSMADGLYFKYSDIDVNNANIPVYDDGTGSNAGPIIDWAIETAAEHATAMQTLKNEQAAVMAAAAYASGDYNSLNGITTVADLEDELTANYIQGDFVAPSAIESIKEIFQGEQPGSGNTIQTVYSNTIHISKAGFYKFSMQAFYRAASNLVASAMHTAGVDFPPVVLFFGDQETQIKSLYDEGGLDQGIAEGYFETETVGGEPYLYNGKYYTNGQHNSVIIFQKDYYHNDVWFYCSTPGDYTYGVKYLGWANAISQWFIYSPESVTITSYAAAADAEDYEALNAAITASEDKTLGFEAGEYAPYNNAAAFAALAAAKAIDQTATNSKLLVESAIAAMDSWVANTEAVNAFYKGDFADYAEDTTTPLDYTPAGWTASDNFRLMLKNTETYPGLNDASAKSAVMSWSGGITYGETAGYTMPLKPNSTYRLSFKAAGWNNESRSGISVSVLNGKDGLALTDLGTPDRDIEGNDRNTAGMTSYVKYLTTGAAGNYVFHIQSGNNMVLSDFELLKMADVSSVVLKGSFNNWGDPDALEMVKDADTFSYSAELDLSNITDDVTFKPVINDNWMSYSSFTLDAPEGWLADDGDAHNIKLTNSGTLFKTYLITLTWNPSTDALAGWTLKVEGKDVRYDIASVTLSYGKAGAESWSNLELTKDADSYTYTGTLDLSEITENQQFKLVVNNGSDIWLGQNEMDVEAPTGFITNGEWDGDNITLNHGSRTFLSYNVTATWNLITNRWTVAFAPATETFTVGQAGWATAITHYAVDFTGVEGLKAYTATVADDKVTLAEAGAVPAGTALVLKGATKAVPVVESAEAVTNDLKGSNEYDYVINDDMQAQYTFYGLTVKNDVAQFVKLNNGKIKPGKAYLQIEKTATGGARELNVVFAGDATGIDAVVAEKNIEGIYNMNGQRVAAPAKGLYIVNGKKVIMK